MRRTILVALLAMLSLSATAQLRNDDVYKTDLYSAGRRTVVEFPDIFGLVTLKCDLHVHTLFSDGKVWPDVRVNEAWKAGYDAIAITDHLEYRPYKSKKFLNGSVNTANEIAVKRGEKLGLIVIPGVELTHKKPFGHMNALFVKDADALMLPDPLVQVDSALRQGALIQWNHPGWPDNKSTMYDLHHKLIADGKITMFEVHNHCEYYPLTFDWVDKYNLAPTANTDIHDALFVTYGSEPLASPMTLVFAAERSAEGIRKALIERHTAAVFDGNLMATDTIAVALFRACIDCDVVSVSGNNAKVKVRNKSSLAYRVSAGEHRYLLPALSSVVVEVPLDAVFSVDNVWIGHRRHLTFGIEMFQ